MKYKIQSISENDVESEMESAPSPKFMTFSEDELKKQLSPLKDNCENPRGEKIQEVQLKVLNDVSYAEEFLKKLEKAEAWEVE